MFWNKKQTSHSRGVATESFARQYLIEKGLAYIDSNFHCRQGEIDLIMQDGSTYVFVEVKYRKNSNFGGAISAVSLSKQAKIKHCVAFFLHKAKLNEYNTPCRVDVIALEGDINQPQVTWLKNAF
ncbi:YraN family protein [Colwellia sp. KU-HH00111]|uniref:YraN family protein n=1 Tax=Colwellia sp. KU-HH00111 TaxID=3127652 RepID=UPI00310509F3